MAFDEKLAERLRDLLQDQSGYAERKMFGGLAIMLHGHLACGIVKNDLMVRVGPEAYESSLDRPHCRPMDFTGKPLKGMVYVAPEGIRTKRLLSTWVNRGVRYAMQLPPK